MLVSSGTRALRGSRGRVAGERIRGVIGFRSVAGGAQTNHRHSVAIDGGSTERETPSCATGHETQRSADSLERKTGSAMRPCSAAQRAGLGVEHVAVKVGGGPAASRPRPGRGRKAVRGAQLPRWLASAADISVSTPAPSSL